MRVLLIAHYFPPDGGPGAQRPIAFGRHLPAAGVELLVLTRAIPTARGYFDPADETALAAIANRCEIVRAGAAADNEAQLDAMLVAGDAAIREHRPDVVLVTMSPFELWRVAAELGDRHRIPVVFDLRDPWALDGVQDHRTWLHWRRQAQQMRAMLRRADGVVANTPECAELFVRFAPELDRRHVAVITNGWDRADFPSPAPEVERGETLQLVYGGSFLCRELYERERLLRRVTGWLRYRPEPIRPSGRTPVHLLGALRRLRAADSPVARDVRFVAIGQIDDALRRCVDESGVADLVELRGYQSHAELITALRTADALFLTLHGLPPGRRSRIVPGKTYEYLAAGRPMLAALPAGDARDLVAASPRALLCDPCDETEIAARLTSLHAGWRDDRYRVSLPPDEFAEFERAATCARLAAFLERIVTKYGANCEDGPIRAAAPTP